MSPRIDLWSWPGRCRQLALWIAACFALDVGVVQAQVPRVVGHHGILTDAVGAPVADGAYDLTLRIYESPVGSTPAYTEAQSGVPVGGGRFSVILGASSALTLPFDRPYWIGLTVGTGSELSPRMPLTAAPYALSLALPFHGVLDGPGDAVTVKNDIFAMYMRGPVTVEGATDSRIVSRSVSEPGMLHASSETRDLVSGEPRAGFRFDEAASTSGSIFLNRSDTENGFLMESGETGGAVPSLVLRGDHGVVYLGSEHSLLPPDALTSVAFRNEAGCVSSGAGTTSTPLLETVAPLVSTTIDHPPPGGYVFVTGTCEVTMTHTSGRPSYCNVLIGRDTGGEHGGAFLGLPSSAPTGTYRFHVPVSGMARVMSPGPMTLELSAGGCAGLDCSPSNLSVGDRQLSAVYIPSAIGIVGGF